MCLPDVGTDGRIALEPFAQRQKLAAAAVSAAEVHELLRARVGKGAEDDRIEDREDGRVGADADGERQCRGNREAGRSPQRADAEAHVARQVGHDLPPSFGALLAPIVIYQRVAHQRYIPETPRRIASGIVCGHPERDVALNAHVDVKAQLVVDVGRDVWARKAQVPAPARSVAHASAGSARSTRVTACE
jgi:hypothetical protein